MTRDIPTKEHQELFAIIAKACAEDNPYDLMDVDYLIGKLMAYIADKEK